MPPGEVPRLVPVDDRGRRIGEGHPRARLSDADVELIRQLAEGDELYPPMRICEIAEKFEVSRGTVHDIVNFRRRASAPARWKAIGETRQAWA